MSDIDEILSCFHHIHHTDGSRHKVHHCGGKHIGLDYEIVHCICKKHSIDKGEAIGHATGLNMEAIELKFVFSERCPSGGWHIESGKRTEPDS